MLSGSLVRNRALAVVAEEVDDVPRLRLGQQQDAVAAESLESEEDVDNPPEYAEEEYEDAELLHIHCVPGGSYVEREWSSAGIDNSSMVCNFDEASDAPKPRPHLGVPATHGVKPGPSPRVQLQQANAPHDATRFDAPLSTSSTALAPKTSTLLAANVDLATTSTISERSSFVPAEQDGTIPRTAEQRSIYVERLFRAVFNRENVLDGEIPRRESSPRLAGAVIRDAVQKMKIACVKIVDYAVKYHLTRDDMLNKQGLGTLKFTRRNVCLTFEERIFAIAQIFSHFKNKCFAVLRDTSTSDKHLNDLVLLPCAMWDELLEDHMQDIENRAQAMSSFGEKLEIKQHLDRSGNGAKN